MCPPNPESHFKIFGTLLHKLKTEKAKLKTVNNLQGT
jgi:hypothetical protein